MRIAIVGGGASGLAAAWLLDAAHDVTLYERDVVLGGHVRTAGGNVPCPALPAGVRLDAGVATFNRERSPLFHAWLRGLGLPAHDLDGGGATRLFRADGRRVALPVALGRDYANPFERARAWAALHPLARALRTFVRATERRSPSELAACAVGSFLGDDAFAAWACAVSACALPTPVGRARELSAVVAVPVLRDFLAGGTWTHLPGGVSAYVDRVASSLRGRVRLGARLRGVARDARGASVIDEAGHGERYDALVLALPPHRVLSLLLDATEAERARWGGWRGAPVQTALHTDTGLYARRGARWGPGLDLFEREDGAFGCNAWLNRRAGLPTHDAPHYSLAFGMDGELDPARVICRQAHDVAECSQPALATREAIERAQGERRTWVAGAFLGDGLHEGAVGSAQRVAARLGGRSLDARARIAAPAEAGACAAVARG